MSSFFRKNALIGAAEIGGRLPLIFTAGYLAGAVGPEAYGNWVMVVVVQGVLASIAGLGLSASISRLASVATTSRARALLLLSFRISFIALLALSALLLVFSEPIVDVLEVQPDYSSLIPLAALLAVTATTEGLMDAYFKSREQIARQALFILSRTTAEIVAVITVFVALSTPEVDPVSQLLRYAVCIVSIKGILYFLLTWGRKPEIIPSGERHHFLTYGLPIVPTALLTLIATQGDRILLSHLVDKEALGNYAFGATLGSYLVFIGYAVYSLLLPRASRHYENGEHLELTALFRQAQVTLLTLLVPTLSFIALFNHEIIRLTAGSAYKGAVEALLLLAIASGIDQLLGIHEYAFHLVKRPRIIPILTGGRLLLLFLAIVLATQAGGIKWVPWAVLLVTAAFNLIRYLFARRYLELPVPRIVALGLIFWIPVVLWIGQQSDSWSLFLRLPLVAVIAGGAALLLARQIRA